MSWRVLFVSVVWLLDLHCSCGGSVGIIILSELVEGLLERCGRFFEAFFDFCGFGVSCWIYVWFRGRISSSICGVLWFVGIGVSSVFCVLLSYVVELVVGCESTFGMSFSGICWMVVGWDCVSCCRVCCWVVISSSWVSWYWFWGWLS